MSVKEGSLLDEEWREYEWYVNPGSSEEEITRVYRIDNPKHLFVGTTTHRVVDINGVVHCVPNVGYMGCVLRWLPKDPDTPVQF